MTPDSLAGERRTIPIRTEADLWTATERNLSLWDLLDFFPPDAVGPRGPADPPRPYPVQPITIETDLGFSFETDIQFGTWMFRPRSPKHPGMMKWCRERGLAVGDTIVFERLEPRRYRVSLEKSGAQDSRAG
jgi:hypothetical protein